jgi:peptidoglycan DL-endopeptidase CwlO
MKKIIKSFFIILLINCVLVATVFADPLSDKLQAQKSKLQQDKSSLKEIQSKKQDIESNIENLDNQIEGLMTKISENKNQISEKQLDVKNTEIEIEKIDIEIAKDQEVFDDRVRSMYINGNESYISILLSSKGFSDFISKIDVIKKIIEIDKKATKDLNDEKEASKNKKEILKNESIKLMALNTDNEANLAQLQGYINNQKGMIASLKSKEFELASAVDSSQGAVNATLKQIADIRKGAPKISVSRGASTISDNNIIAYATNFLGTPYLWGGSSPSTGFDCSGFTQYVYAHFGISLGRTTYDQINNGVSVSKSNLQAGDLVFFGTNGPTHMGIYIGNGTYINAPHTGDVVKISSINRSDYITARRVK